MTGQKEKSIEDLQAEIDKINDDIKIARKMVSDGISQQVSKSREQSSEAITQAQKNLILLNGGATVAILAFLPALLTLSQHFTVELKVAIESTVSPILNFIGGLITCLLSIFLRHLHQKFLVYNLSSLQIDMHFDKVNGNITWKEWFRDSFVSYCMYGALIASTAIFCYGVWQVKLAIVSIFS